MKKAIKKWSAKLKKLRYEEQRARGTFPRKQTTHERMIAALCGSDETVFRSGFLAALYVDVGAVLLSAYDGLEPSEEDADPDETDRQYLDDCFDSMRGVLPDAYRINVTAKKVTVFEVEDTYPLSWEKVDRYLALFWMLDNYDWDLEIVVVDRSGHARHADVTLLAHEVLAKKPRGKRPAPWLQPKIHDVKNGKVPSLTEDDYPKEEP